VKTLTALLIGSLIAVANAQTPAGRPPTTLKVSAQVVGGCQISATPLAFGTYDPIATHATTPLDADTVVTLKCTLGVTPQIRFDAGQQPSGSMRQMTDGSSGRLQYELFSSAARTTPTTPGDVRIIIGTSGSDDVRVYGRIRQAQDVPVGAYSDTVIVTVTY
jgi:spore coat protein U-like protein